LGGATALIGTMVYSFARVGAVVTMKVGDVFEHRKRCWLRLHEKGGKRHEVPCHPTAREVPETLDYRRRPWPR